jgi:hypothetical protein
MGRRVYWQAVILVVMNLRQSRATGKGVNQLMRMFSIPRKTIVRWISYFRCEFPVSREWLRFGRRWLGGLPAVFGDGASIMRVCLWARKRWGIVRK